ncbi:aldehyde dehydrogenase [Ferviditalea candida]|uniref:Aldehyde dehydrogenase n=1 Tax=Ferviditalea candida TaxID=3108399 RepID=A0ABU5ZPJ1_9BACL|nr:aldehyde dehydrogenase [Paenibacillaceae bacterium T2]
MPINREMLRSMNISEDHYIGGKRIASTDRFEVRSPLDWSEPIANMARGTAEDADRAVSAARQAFPEWASLSAAERGTYLRRLADLIERNTDRIAETECLDVGLLLRSLKARLVNRGAHNFRYYAELAENYEERTWSSKGTVNRVMRMPAGPAVIITPWNAPFMLSTWKTAPALAAGCTVVLKPPEWAPLSCSILASLADEAGLPPGVFNVIQGIGEEVGAALVRHPDVRRIGFTGSPETGRFIAHAGAGNLVPITAELGGKGPFLVFEDCDIEAAAEKAALQYDDAGQVCLAGTRLLVQKSIYDNFASAFFKYTDAHVLGDSREDHTTVAPLIHPDHLQRVEGFVERARANGDKIVRGGHRTSIGGLWYEPTLIEPKSNESEIVQNEVFGPVLTIQTFENEEEAIALANSTKYGLSAIIYTASAERAERVGRAVRAGTVWTNCFLVRDLSAPFGGTGISGIGREGGDYALDFYSDLKTFQVKEGTTE